MSQSKMGVREVALEAGMRLARLVFDKRGN